MGIHDDKLQIEYRNSPDFGQLGYEQQLHSFLLKLVSQLDRTIKRGKERLGIKPADSDEKQERIVMLEEKIKKALTEMEAAGEDGNMDEAQRLGSLAESMKAELEAIKNADDKNPILRHEKRMEVCGTCGAFLVMGDSSDRVEAHLTGKQHTGYLRIREALEESKNSDVDRRRDDASYQPPPPRERDFRRGAYDRRERRDEFRDSSRDYDHRGGRDFDRRDYRDRDRERDVRRDDYRRRSRSPR
ncbi:Luc7-like protein 3 [Nowakowskiella sp. JEL0078]|nr:Luc7-like protein 3 [Nowakowskiella sp. JEL0078]